jgi:NIMA (never in mitosis gene a)-related kinase
MQTFDVLAKLGEGAYSTVFKVRRKADDRIYALKQVKLLSLNEKEKANALNEIRILASVRHTNIVSYKEAFFDNQNNTLW